MSAPRKAGAIVAMVWRIAVGLLLVLAGAGCMTGDEAQMARMKELSKSLDVDIRFYGKVLDQFDQPVMGAEVELCLTHFSPSPTAAFTAMKRLTVKTDEHGAFSVTRARGCSLSVEQVVKEGYEFSWERNPLRSFNYSAGWERIFVPDEKAPVVFRVRKKGATTFVLSGEDLAMGCHVKDSGKAMGYDFIQDAGIDNPANPAGPDRDRTCDLELTATFDKDNSTWKLTLRPGNAGGGIQASEELLYEAPEVGYTAEHVIVPERHKLPKTRYIYLRSREPVIYTRAEIAAVVVGSGFVRLCLDSVTNPYGDRNLEGEPDLPYEVIKPLTDEARAALRQKKLPPKPDLQKLIKEAKAAGKWDEGKP